MNAKLVESMTAILHCLFGIIATAGDKNFLNGVIFRSVSFFLKFQPKCLVSYLYLSNKWY